jgi:hypothetical protein
VCLAVYIAAGDHLPLIAWEERDPAFYSEPAEPDDGVRAHLDGPHLVYLGSHEGCGCGFILEGPHEEDAELRRASLQSMIDYVGRASNISIVQLWVGWEGDQSKVPDLKVELCRSRVREAGVWARLFNAAFDAPCVVTIQPGDRDSS